MPEIITIRIPRSWDVASTSPPFEILLQRRSIDVEEGYTWCLPGGKFESDEFEAFKNAKDQENDILKDRISRRAALRSVIEQMAMGSSPGATPRDVMLHEISGTNPPLPVIRYQAVLLPHGLRNFFECYESFSRYISLGTFMYLLSPDWDQYYLRDWRPRAMESRRWEIDESHTSAALPDLYNGYIWVPLEDFLQNAGPGGRPVRGSSCGCPSWLHRFYTQPTEAAKVRDAAIELYRIRYPSQAVSPLPITVGKAIVPGQEQPSYLGMPVYSDKSDCADLVLKEMTPSGKAFRVYIGNGGSALSVCLTSELTVHEAGETTEYPKRVIHTVVNCAAADEPYKYMNSRSGIVYANVVTSDWPRPSYDSDQRPCWHSALTVIRASHDQAIAKDDDLNVLIHCAHGKNRSVTTAALSMCDLYPSAFVDIATAVKRIKKYRKNAKPFSVYLQWAQEKLDEIRSSGGGIGLGTALIPFPPDPPMTNKGCAVLLLKSYELLPEQTHQLTLYCIIEGNNKICVPLETRDRIWANGPACETEFDCAARALDEELHFSEITAANLADPTQFERVDLSGLPVIFISRTLYDHHSIGRYKTRRQEIEQAHHSGEKYWKGRRIHDYLETIGMRNITVESLLSGNYTHIRSLQFYALTEPLRGIFLKIISHQEIRRILQERLVEFRGH